jgi:hypothetical protein
MAMGKHEQKNCPRCGTAFECRVGDVANCQCHGIELPVAAADWMAQQYGDCLCRHCLLQLKAQSPMGNAYRAAFKKRST